MTTAYLRLDLHANSCTLGVMDQSGTFQGHQKFSMSDAELTPRVSSIEADTRRLALEASTLSRWVARTLDPHVEEVKVCDPRENQLLSHNPTKSDDRNPHRGPKLYRTQAPEGPNLRIPHDRPQASGRTLESRTRSALSSSGSGPTPSVAGGSVVYKTPSPEAKASIKARSSASETAPISRRTRPGELVPENPLLLRPGRLRNTKRNPAVEPEPDDLPRKAAENRRPEDIRIDHDLHDRSSARSARLSSMRLSFARPCARIA